MSLELLDVSEHIVTYPTTPVGMTARAAEIPPAVIWGRIYEYIAYRWGKTTISWRVQGCGEFVPRVTPCVVDDIFYWTSTGWNMVTLPDGPMGIDMPADNIWKIDATAGGDVLAVPAKVARAYILLAEYMASAKSIPAGVASVTSGALGIRFQRDAAARALQNSGAADLLRSYRKLGVE